MTQRNSPERKAMLADRRSEQRDRTFGRWELNRQGQPVFTRLEHPALRPASINRRTGKPHDSVREMERGCTHDRRHTNERFSAKYGAEVW